MASSAIVLSYACAQCGKITQRAYRGSGTKPTLCSNACKVAGFRERQPERWAELRERERAKHAASVQPSTKVWFNVCAACSRLFAGRAKHAIHCGAECRRRAANQEAAARWRAEHPLEPRRCEVCSSVFAPRHGAATLCSDACKRVALLPGKRAARTRRKALQRGATVERFDPLEVLERDRWRCHLCGVKTPKRLRGTYDDRAPELDHIIPLAAGGEHSRRNTACACRRCNIAKGDKPLGQLRLVA